MDLQERLKRFKSKDSIDLTVVVFAVAIKTDDAFPDLSFNAVAIAVPVSAAAAVGHEVGQKAAGESQESHKSCLGRPVTSKQMMWASEKIRGRAIAKKIASKNSRSRSSVTLDLTDHCPLQMAK